MLIIEPIMVKKIGTQSPISYKHMPFWCPLLDPHLAIYHTQQCIGVHIIVGLYLGTSKSSS